MPHAWRWLAPVLVLASIAFFPGIDWGLPSAAADPFLFGEAPVWPGQKILDLAGGWTDRNLGADVDPDPLQNRDRLLDLTATDTDRAKILLRYRLYSNQPDEMITFRSLSKIKQNRGDPRLYQYGGLWTYPVGLLLQLADWLGYLDLRGDVAYYLDHPQAFARFYVVARIYSALWGLIGAAALFFLLRRLTNHSLLAALGAAGYSFLPVVVNSAHEAKPHLAGTVLTLLAVLGAMRYVESGRRRDAWIAGALCGAAFGMVVSAVLAFTILPTMVLIRPNPWPHRLRHLLQATAAGLLVYAVTNPFVPFNLLFNRDVLFSNLTTSTAMYGVQLSVLSAANALLLVLEGASPFLAIAGLLGAAALALRPTARRATPVPPLLPLLAVPAVCNAIQFVLLATNKPGEYGRFALLLDVSLLIAAILAIASFVQRPRDQVGLTAVLVASIALFGFFSVRAFVRDAGPEPARLLEARRLASLADAGARTLAVTAEPAPYSLPPVNLFHWKLVLVPRGGLRFTPESAPDVIIRPIDTPVPPISGPFYETLPDLRNRSPRWHPKIPWADKPFDVRRRVSSGTSNPHLALRASSLPLPLALVQIPPLDQRLHLPVRD